MTPLEAFWEYLRLSCRLSLAVKQDDSHYLTVRLSSAYAMLATESQKVAYAVGQEFHALEDGAESAGRYWQWSAFWTYLQFSVALSEVVVKRGLGSELANEISDCMTVYWHRMQDSSMEVCGLVNEEFNRLEALL